MPTTPAKYLINPLPAGGFPLENEDLLTLQEVPRVALNAALAGLGTCFVLSGCDCFDQDADAGTAYVNPGYIFIDGQVRYFAGNLGGIVPFYVTSDTNSVTQKTFEDGNSKDTAVSLRTKIQTNRPVSSQFVTFNPGPVEKISTMITGALATALASEVQARQSADVALTTAVNGKQNRVTSKIPWTDIVITNPDITSIEITTDPAAGNFGCRPQYMRTEDGMVHLRGYLRWHKTSGNATLMATLPQAVKPPHTVSFSKRNFQTGSLPFSVNFVFAVRADATFYIDADIPTNDYNYITLDGICYSVEA